MHTLRLLASISMTRVVSSILCIHMYSISNIRFTPGVSYPSWTVRTIQFHYHYFILRSLQDVSLADLYPRRPAIDGCCGGPG